MSKFDAREFERSLVEAGYMPTSEYVRRWGELDAPKPSYEISVDVLKHHLHASGLCANAQSEHAKPEANPGERAND